MHQSKNNHLFCFGHGYSCTYLARALISDGGWAVSGTTRDEDRKCELRADGVNAFMFDTNSPLADPLYMMRDVSHVLISTPPSDDGDPSFLAHAQDLLRLPKLQWVGYLSTTGPYGDRDGDWVDERSTPRPTTKRGSRRLKSEEQWLSLYEQHNLPVHIFRLAGIYGPGRSALDSIRSGVARRIDKPGHAFSRIYVDDIVQVLFASMVAAAPGEVYNLCDDEPAPSHEVIDYACQLLGVSSPPLIPYDSVDLAPITRSFYADNKRVRNDKIKQALGVDLKYKNYREGLQACLDAEEQALPSFIPISG